MSRVVVDAVAARLASQVPSRTVYKHAVPDVPAARYLFVYGTADEQESLDLGDSQQLASCTVWVTSTAVGDRVQAADEATWAADKVALALKGWRPAVGSAAWKPVPLGSQPARQDEALPDVTAMYAVQSYLFTYQP